MRLFFKGKDGGPESNVTGYWLIEWKAAFSIVLLRFDKGSREAYHSHAFNAISWVLKGLLHEYVLGEDGLIDRIDPLWASFLPYYTPRERMHKVYGIADKTWVLSFRGPWVAKWQEWFDKTGQTVTLTHGRRVMEA